MFNTPGFIKFFFPKQFVENKYQSISQIPIMTIDKQIIYIPEQKTKNSLYVHFTRIPSEEKLLQLKQKFCLNKNCEVFLLPSQNSKLTFNDIKKSYPNAFGKMILNGKNVNPLIMYLKRNCESLYDYDMLGSKKIDEEFGVFVVKQQDIAYFGKSKIEKLSKQRYIDLQKMKE